MNSSEGGGGNGGGGENGGEVAALLARARGLLEGADVSDDATRLKALEDLYALLEEELDRHVEQNPPRH